MTNKIQLPLDSNSMLLGKELYYIDLVRLHWSNTNRNIFKSTLSGAMRNEYTAAIAMRCSYSRFNLDKSAFNLKDHPMINHIPDLSFRNYNTSFTEITDTLATDLLEYSKTFDNVYLFWSGGIDSTLILSAILKNWPTAELQRLTIVLNEQSINEYPKMYFEYICDKIPTMDFNAGIKLKNTDLYITGNHGDSLISLGTASVKFNDVFPNIYNKPWRHHRYQIMKYFSLVSDWECAYMAYTKIEQSLQKYNIPAETVYDFLSWMEFEWGWSIDSIYLIWAVTLIDNDCDLDTLLNKNVFRWFTDSRYQQWALSNIGNVGFDGTVATNKLPYKQYIYDFNNDLDYFQNKLKELSLSKTNQMINNDKVIAVDTAYNIYYRPL